MIFSIPENREREFLRTVAAIDGSYIAKALDERMKAEEIALARACDTANSDEDIHAMEQEFDAISADIAEPWTDDPAR